MNTTTTSAARVPSSADAIVRRFNKAKIVAERLGVCPRTLSVGGCRTDHRHKVNARIVLFDEAEVTAFIESERI